MNSDLNGFQKPKKAVFLLIRYSVLSKYNGGWEIRARNSYEEYKKLLFDPERMELHEELFESMTFPSLINNLSNAPSDVLLKAIIITSASLPQNNRKFLESICAGTPELDILYVDENKRFGEEVKRHIKKCLQRSACPQGLCATVRLDDDDALSDNFIVQLNDYLNPKFTNFCVSFGLGYHAHHFGHSMALFSECYYPKSPQGITYISEYDLNNKKVIGDTILSLGSHGKVDLKKPTVLDSRYPAFMYSIHSQSDVAIRIVSRGKNISDIVQKKTISKLSEVRDSFSWIQDKFIHAKPRLVTFHGKVISYDKNKNVLKQASPDEVEKYELLYADLEQQKLVTKDGLYLSLVGDSFRLCSESGDCLVLKEVPNENKAFLLSPSDGTYLSAEKNGRYSLKKERKDWEMFAPF